MQNKNLLLKTGNLISAFVFSISVAQAVAPQPQFNVQVDRNRISLDDTIALKLVVSSESSNRLGTPEFDAPDFDVVNEFSSVSIQSQYDPTRGGFSTENRQQITKVMRPRKAGNLKISGIRLSVNGRYMTAPDIIVQVASSGQPSPQAPRQRGLTVDSLDPPPTRGRQAFVRAEVDKPRLYKGEQVIVSYYLYHQVKIFNVQVDKYPVLNGFLREDLDIPVVGQRLLSERVTLNGIPYERTLLAQYAAYALQEGTLSVDSMALKYNYYAMPRDSDGDDPLFGFFQQMTPRVGSAQSEQVRIEVADLPAAGRPQTFGGGVGDFNVVSAVNKYEVRANEAVTLTVKVEGKGNTAAIHEPKAQWPDSVELYDSKGRASPSRGGVGEKVFEFLLIPRTPGKVERPPLEFGFFDPKKKEYYTKSTQPVTLTVLDPAPGTTLVLPTKDQAVGDPQRGKFEKESKPLEMRYLKAPSEGASDLFLLPIWRFLYLGCSIAFAFLLVLIGKDLFQKARKKVGAQPAPHFSDSKQWENLHRLAQTALSGIPWNDVVGAYDVLSHLILEAIDAVYSVGAKSLSLDELKRRLVDEQGLAEGTWERITRLLEFSDLVRFASSVGGVSEAKARADLQKWVTEAEVTVKTLDRVARPKNAKV